MGYTSGTMWTVPRGRWRTILTLKSPSDRTELWEAYMRIADSDATQFLTRFMRDPWGVKDHTGSSNPTATPGKDFINTMWFFQTRGVRLVGIQLWHDATGDLTVEYAQLKVMGGS